MRGFSLLVVLLAELRIFFGAASANVTRSLAVVSNENIYINEFDTNNSAFPRVEIAASKNVDANRKELRRLESGGYYGDTIDFYDGLGKLLGTLTMSEQTPVVYPTNEPYEFATFAVNSNLVPKEGGILCLKGTGVARIVYYGATANLVNISCDAAAFSEEDVAFYTRQVPTNGYSYQRFGIGFEAGGSEWRIKPETFSHINQDQSYAVCPFKDACGPSFTKQRMYRICRDRPIPGLFTKCVPAPIARWRLRHGYTCGKCRNF